MPSGMPRTRRPSGGLEPSAPEDDTTRPHDEKSYQDDAVAKDRICNRDHKTKYERDHIRLIRSDPPRRCCLTGFRRVLGSKTRTSETGRASPDASFLGRSLRTRTASAPATAAMPRAAPRSAHHQPRNSSGHFCPVRIPHWPLCGVTLASTVKWFPRALHPASTGRPVIRSPTRSTTPMASSSLIPTSANASSRAA
jgi:hypothetical protein